MNKSIAKMASTHTFMVVPLFFLVLLFILTGNQIGVARAADTTLSGVEAQAAKTVKLLKKHNHKVARELGQIKREIAALRVEMHGVSLSKIFSGIGYILGLCGVAALVVARNKEKMLADLQRGDN